MEPSLIFTIFFTIFNCQITQSGFLDQVLFPIIRGYIDSQYQDPWINVRIYFYYGQGNLQNASYQLKDANQLLNHPNFNIEKITTFYIHGYSENQTSESVQVLKNAYSNLSNHNFVALDYSLYVEENKKTDYVKAFAALPYVASFVTQGLIRLFDVGLPIKNFHLVGHSLGGHLGGYVGREIIEKSNNKYKLPRISALDPAFPGYYVLPNVIAQLNPKDAIFVDVIHTDSGVYGAPVSTGTVDFWPNGGYAVQPGCPVPRHWGSFDKNDFCSHHRSWRFWAESVENLFPQKFVAFKAISYKDYKLHIYEDKEPTVMGLDASLESTGNYYLHTNGDSPYAQG